jgi:hypothetical protein
MSDARLDAVKRELLLWVERLTGSKRQVLSLLGKLVFLSRIIRPGRIFMRRLITMSTRATKLHHQVKLTKGARDDITWWLDCVREWNQRSFFYDDYWLSSIDLELYTDASGKGIGGVFGWHWFMAQLTVEQSTMSIAWRELYAVLVACVTWGKALTTHRLLVHCDNASVVAIVNSGSSRCPKVMNLVRDLFHVAVYHNFDIRLIHVPGVDNTAADLLSRLEEDKFRFMFAGQYDQLMSIY